MKDNVKLEYKIGDIFSECSFYRIVDIVDSEIKVLNTKSNSIITVNKAYVDNCLISGDYYHNIEYVNSNYSASSKTTMASIWNSIGVNQVFTVEYAKMAVKKSKKALEEELNNEIRKTLTKLNGASSKDKLKIISDIYHNPINEYLDTEVRKLRGYKLSSYSTNGYYTCVDLDLVNPQNPKSHSIRPVNINTIKSLIVNGVKYIVK